MEQLIFNQAPLEYLLQEATEYIVHFLDSIVFMLNQKNLHELQ